MTGAMAAEQRVATLFDRLARTNLEAVAIARRDPTRSAAMARGREAARAAGRARLLDEATSAVRDAVLRSFSRRGFSGTWALTEWNISMLSSSDRLAVVEAYEEAAVAAVTEDLLDEQTLAVLTVTADRLTGLSQLPLAGSLSEFSPTSAIRNGPVRLLFGILFVFLVVGGLFFGTGGLGFVVLAAIVVIAVHALRTPRA